MESNKFGGNKMKDAATLSNKETRVVSEIAQGKTKKEIANELGLSVRTIENQTRSALKKTGCRKSTELVGWWLNNQKCTA